MRFFILIAFTVGISSIFLSCQKEDDNIIDNRLDLNGSCGIDGDDCGQLNSELTYNYISNRNDEQITWSVVSGEITLVSGQGTSRATFLLGSDFSEGIVQVESDLCLLKKTISLCD